MSAVLARVHSLSRYKYVFYIYLSFDSGNELIDLGIMLHRIQISI